MVTAEPRLDLADAMDVDDRRAMDAYEPRGIEPRLEVDERLSELVLASARVDAYVVAAGGDPVDLGRGDQPDAAAIRDGEVIRVRRGHLLEAVDEPAQLAAIE